MLMRINRLINEIIRDPFTGSGLSRRPCPKKTALSAKEFSLHDLTENMAYGDANSISINRAKVHKKEFMDIIFLHLSFHRLPTIVFLSPLDYNCASVRFFLVLPSFC